MYSEAEEIVLDPMVGSGTTLVEAKLLGRSAIGIDINPEAVAISVKALDFKCDNKGVQEARVGDARDLNEFEEETFDLVITHPPYLNIIRYSDGTIPGDLSNTGSLPKFLDEITAVAREIFRVLRQDKYCAILIGDTRRSKHFVPLAFNVMQRFLKAGFVLREDIIKAQHNCRETSRWVGKAKHGKFYLIMHEHLFVFRKPRRNENLSRVRYSTLL
jgi:DNA modification methylase